MNFAGLKLIVFDFDGVFTDNRVIVSQDGTESVVCNRGDGMGLSKIRSLGAIDMMILSTETVPVAQFRAKKLKLECIIGCDDKLARLKEVVAGKGVGLQDVAFVGNDINDLEVLQAVGFPVCVNDAYPEVKSVCRLILDKKGGDGAVREFCELVYQQRKK
jgi:3-deoxy-D-manno-octulosonate 8-phosphate phosphatase (KDO 8-P phosphatase)